MTICKIAHTNACNSRVDSWPHPQTLDQDVKACQGQTIWLITNIRLHAHKSFIVQTPGADVKKLYGRNLRVFVLSYSVCPWQAFQARSNKHSSLVQKLVNYGQKSFITLGPGVTQTNVNVLTLSHESQDSWKVPRQIRSG